VLFTSLLDLVHGERLSVARVDGSDIERFHLLERSLQRLRIVDDCGDRRVGPVFKEVSAEEFPLIGQHRDAPSRVPGNMQDRCSQPILVEAIAVFKEEVRCKSITLAQSEEAHQLLHHPPQRRERSPAEKHVPPFDGGYLRLVHRDFRSVLRSQIRGIAAVVRVPVGNHDQLKITKSAARGAKIAFEYSTVPRHSTVDQDKSRIVLH